MLYCKNADCGVYLGSMGADSCSLCGYVDQDAIESAACADRDARIAELEQRNRDLYEDVQRFKEHALSEKDARMALERELAEARKDAERYRFIRDANRSSCIDREIALYATESLDECVDTAMEDEAKLVGDAAMRKGQQ